jgi:hypothetical protein
MEKNMYRDNFEQLLKDTTDNFRMYPSRRIWHSLYNDLHPSKKWPSLSVWFLFIVSVLFIGLPTNKESVPTSSYGNNDNVKFVRGSNASDLVYADNPDAKKKQRTSSERISGIGLFSIEEVAPDADAIVKEPLALSTNYAALMTASSEYALLPVFNDISTENQTAGYAGNLSNHPSIRIQAAVPEMLENNSEETKDKDWMEDFALHNLPVSRGLKPKLAYQFYATPSIGYRELHKNNKYSPENNISSFMAGQSATVHANPIDHMPAFNLEAGGNILYRFSKSMRLKAGLQLNYTNYQINSAELDHPILTTVMYNDPNNGMPLFISRSTTLANTGGMQKTLNNNTYQVSIPFGADIKLLGSENIQWFAGATVQPTFVTSGKGYLLSADLKNYVLDESLIRRWNINGGIETFISYKTKEGIILNAGPQFRYQLLSTYSKQYSYDERLYNLGIKMGVTTNF